MPKKNTSRATKNSAGRASEKPLSLKLAVHRMMIPGEKYLLTSLKRLAIKVEDQPNMTTLLSGMIEDGLIVESENGIGLDGSVHYFTKK